MTSTPTFITLTDYTSAQPITINLDHVRTIAPERRFLPCAACAAAPGIACPTNRGAEPDDYDEPVLCRSGAWETFATHIELPDIALCIAEAYADIIQLINRKAALVIDARIIGAPEVAG